MHDFVNMYENIGQSLSEYTSEQVNECTKSISMP